MAVEDEVIIVEHNAHSYVLLVGGKVILEGIVDFVIEDTVYIGGSEYQRRTVFTVLLVITLFGIVIWLVRLGKKNQ